MSDNWRNHILLENPEYFDFGNGLWTGKKPPFKTVTVIRNTNFTDSGKIDYSNVAVLEVEQKQFEQRKLIKGDIVIERSGGGPKQPVGRVVYFDKDNGDFSFSNFTSRIRVINQELNTGFVFYFLMYFYEAGNTFEMQAQTTGIRNLDFTKYKNSVRIPLIPLYEQHQIVYLLSTVQKAIEQQDKLIRHTTELKKVLMQKLFTEGTKGEKQKQTEIGLVPESWELLRIGNSVKIKGGFAFKSEEGVANSNTQLVRMGNLYQNKLDLERAPIFYPDNYSKEFSNYVLNEGDLIMSLTGTMGKEDYGFTVKVPKTNKTLLLNQRIAKFEVINDEINKDYLKQYFLSRVFLDKLYKTAKGTKQANLSSNEMKTLFLLKPQPKEQLEIANTLGLLECKIEILEKRKQTLSFLFKTLLQELVTGQRQVNEIEFEALSKAYKINEQSLSMAAES